MFSNMDRTFSEALFVAYKREICLDVTKGNFDKISNSIETIKKSVTGHNSF